MGELDKGKTRNPCDPQELGVSWNGSPNGTTGKMEEE
jgi:hypothetical protein